MTNLRDAKKELRARLRARRETLAREEIAAKSRAITALVVGAEEFRVANTVALYRACFGEVDTDGIFFSARSAGKKVMYPNTDVKNHVLVFRIVDVLDDMVSGAWGIPEPPPTARIAPLGEAGLVIIPGVAFDREGGRLGMGGGFYDRVIGDLPESAVKMGVAYNFQVFDRIPLEKSDERVDCLVTESGVTRFKERGRHVGG